jgi:hypothetical protein
MESLPRPQASVPATMGLQGFSTYQPPWEHGQRGRQAIMLSFLCSRDIMDCDPTVCQVLAQVLRTQQTCPQDRMLSCHTNSQCQQNEVCGQTRGMHGDQESLRLPEGVRHILGTVHLHTWVIFTSAPPSIISMCFRTHSHSPPQE